MASQGNISYYVTGDRDKDLTKAILMADEIRRDHNGVMSVEIHLGHDGDNTVRFRDYERVLSEASCGREADGLLVAVRRAHAELRVGRFFRSQSVRSVAEAAARLFDDDGRNRIFNTAGFTIAAVNNGLVLPIDDYDMTPILAASPSVVRLKGGAHWYVLPDDLEMAD